MSQNAWTLTIPRAAKLSVPIDFIWQDDKSPRDVSGNVASIVLHKASDDQSVTLRQDAGTVSRMWLDTVETTFPIGWSGPSEIALSLNGAVVDRLFGKMTIDTP
jgi:hypothetical protein